MKSCFLCVVALVGWLWYDLVLVGWLWYGCSFSRLVVVWL